MKTATVVKNAGSHYLLSELPAWNVFPAVDGDHMYLQGGLTRRHDVRAFYLGLLTLISAQGR